MFPFCLTYVKKPFFLFSGPLSFFIMSNDNNTNTGKRGTHLMNIGMMIICAIGGLTGFLSAAYLLVSMPVVIIWKIYRKIRFGYKMYQ